METSKFVNLYTTELFIHNIIKLFREINQLLSLFWSCQQFTNFKKFEPFILLIYFLYSSSSNLIENKM